VVLGGGKRRISVVGSSVAVVVREHVTLGRHRVRARTISDSADIRGALVRRPVVRGHVMPRSAGRPGMPLTLGPGE
jgi:hypothetical protein